MGPIIMMRPAMNEIIKGVDNDGFVPMESIWGGADCTHKLQIKSKINIVDCKHKLTIKSKMKGKKDRNDTMMSKSI